MTATTRTRMAAALVTAALLAGAPAARGGVVTKIRDTGRDSNRLVIAIVAEGYRASEQARFDADAAATLADFLATPPWSSYTGHVNVYTDFVTSNESGADKPAPCYSPEVFRDTAFGGRYCGGGSQRLLLVNTGAVLTEIAVAVPQADSIGVVVNDPEYGGAGGSILTFSTNASARSELFLHEHGHSFARLADEYTTPYPGFPPGDGEPNVDFDSQRGMIDWDPWIEATTPLPTPPAMTTVVGAFEGARYLSTGIFRPMADCKMRTLNRSFCPVCAEAIVQSLYAVVSPIDDREPASPFVGYDGCDPGASVTLAVTPLLPVTTAWMTARWEIDGVLDGETGFSRTLTAAELGGLPRTVTVIVQDETPLVRRPFRSPMTASMTWFLDPSAGPDRDGDGVSDACDCAPDDGTASAPPAAESGLLRVDRPSRLSWPASAPEHDIARGLISRLRAGGDTSGDCLPAAGATSLDDADSPGLGAAFWYLVRDRNACGAGPWGARSDGAARTVTACP